MDASHRAAHQLSTVGSDRRAPPAAGATAAVSTPNSFEPESGDVRDTSRSEVRAAAGEAQVSAAAASGGGSGGMRVGVGSAGVAEAGGGGSANCVARGGGGAAARAGERAAFQSCAWVLFVVPDALTVDTHASRRTLRLQTLLVGMRL